MEELVSVIIPTYNRIDTLERAIESVKNQTYKNIEILVIDDNANNKEIREKIKNLVSKFNDVQLILNKENLGGALTRNEGIKNAKGKYIAFLDDDDEFYPQKIEKQYNLYKKLNNEKVGLIYCYAKFIQNKGEKIHKKDYEGIPLKEHLISCIAATSWWFCPKSVLEDIGGFEDVSSHQDAIVLFKMLDKGYEIYRVPEILLNYYDIHSETRITRLSSKWIEVDNKYKEMYKNIQYKFSRADNKEITYSFCKRADYYYYRLNNKSKLKENTKEMLRIYPFKINTLKSLIKNIVIRLKNNKVR